MFWNGLTHQINFQKIILLVIILLVIPADARAEGNDVCNETDPAEACIIDERTQDDIENPEPETNYPRYSFVYDESRVITFSVESDGKTNLSKNFKVSEFRCLDGSDEVVIDLGLVDALQYIRDYFNAPLHINSAYRTKEHNSNIGGSEDSYNLLGRGVDFYVEGISNEEVASLAEYIGIKGIVVFSDSNYSLHIDSRTTLLYKYYNHETTEYTDALLSEGGRYFCSISIDRLSHEHYTDNPANLTDSADEETDNSDESDNISNDNTGLLLPENASN